jgi:hypothetical protein
MGNNPQNIIHREAGTHLLVRVQLYNLNQTRTQSDQAGGLLSPESDWNQSVSGRGPLAAHRNEAPLHGP